MTGESATSGRTTVEVDAPYKNGSSEPLTASKIVEGFLDDVRGGQNWFLALLNAVSVWTAPNEKWNARQYTYVIAGEAFDWLLLAERLTEAAGELIPEGEATRLLFEGRAPVHINAELFRRAIGHGKHAAHLNFLYGIVVEEALQQANIEEVAKAQQNLGAREKFLEDEAMTRLYGGPIGDLRTEFRLASGRGGNAAVRSSLDEYKAFTYWLFKRRVSKSDPARLASDTRKGIPCAGPHQTCALGMVAGRDRLSDAPHCAATMGTERATYEFPHTWGVTECRTA